MVLPNSASFFAPSVSPIRRSLFFSWANVCAAFLVSKKLRARFPFFLKLTTNFNFGLCLWWYDLTLDFLIRALMLPLVATFQVKMAYFRKVSVNMRLLKMDKI